MKRPICRVAEIPDGCCVGRSPPPGVLLLTTTLVVLPRKPPAQRLAARDGRSRHRVGEIHRVPAFVFGSGPGTTPAPNEAATALQPPRVARLLVSRANSYLRATPRLARLFSADHSPSPGLPNPARPSRSQVSSRLHRVSHVASGYYPTGASPDGHAPARPTFAPVETTGDFRGQKRQASSYPSAKAVRGSAPSLTRLTGKRLPAFRG